MWSKLILLSVLLIGYSVNGEDSRPRTAYRSKYSKVILFSSWTSKYSFSRDGQWALLLADRLERVADVVNRGFGGYTSRRALLRLPNLFPETFGFDDVSCFVIFLGSNDCVNSPNKDLGVPIEEYMANMAAIVRYLVERGLPRDNVILITPPKTFEEKWPPTSAFGRDDATTARYAAALVEVGQVMQVDVVDLYQIFTDSQKGSQLVTDGVHFTVEGSKLLFNALWPLVESRVVKHAVADTLT